LSQPSYRNATLDDLSRLLVLEQKLIDSERPYDRFLKEKDVTYYDLPGLISNSDSNLVVAEENKNIIGSGYAQIRPSDTFHQHSHHCYLGFIFVEPGYRGRNIASGIIDALKNWGIDQGVRHFQLNVYSENEGAIRAYEKFGFSKAAIRMELVV